MSSGDYLNVKVRNNAGGLKKKLLSWIVILSFLCDVERNFFLSRELLICVLDVCMMIMCVFFFV
jgi:hypothetical protein